MTYAIFSEWTRDDDIHQDLFIPSVMVGTRALAPTLWTRQFTARGGRRKWNAVPNAGYARSSLLDGLTTLVSREVDQFEGISNWMTSVVADPAWDLRGYFPVLVSPSDFAALAESGMTMPADLDDRIRSLRRVQGWDDVSGAAK